jgi:hypothetical protein
MTVKGTKRCPGRNTLHQSTSFPANTKSNTQKKTKPNLQEFTQRKRTPAF